VHLLPAAVPTGASRTAASGAYRICVGACAGVWAFQTRPTLCNNCNADFHTSHVPLTLFFWSPPLSSLLFSFTRASTRPAVGARCSWSAMRHLVPSHARSAPRCAPHPPPNCFQMQSHSSCCQRQQQCPLAACAWAKRRQRYGATHVIRHSATTAAHAHTAKEQ
jgi:hypothetical protein